MLPDNTVYMILWGFALSMPFAAQVSHIMEHGGFKPTLALWIQAVLIFSGMLTLMLMPVALIIRYLFPVVTWGDFFALGVLLLLSLRLIYISYRRRPLTVMKLHTGMQILLSVMAGLNVLIYTLGTQMASDPPRPLLLLLFLLLPAFVLLSILMVSGGFRKTMANSRIDIIASVLALGLTLIWGWQAFIQQGF